MRQTQPIKFALVLTVTVLLSSCVILPKQNVTSATTLAGCPPSPNCVSTQSGSTIHKLEPFVLVENLSVAWPKVVAAVEALPNTEISVREGNYLHAKSISKVFRFVDYVEVLADPDQNLLQVRSSSMLGFSDMGVNRKRAEQLREALLKAGVIAPNQ